MDAGLALARRLVSSCLNHCVGQALLSKTRVWIERVASVDNVADLPSRMKYWLLGEIGDVLEMGATWRPPVVSQFVVDGVTLEDGSWCGPEAAGLRLGGECKLVWCMSVCC